MFHRDYEVSWGSTTPGTVVNWLPTRGRTDGPCTCIVIGSDTDGRTVILWDVWGSRWEFTSVTPDTVIENDWYIVAPERP